MNRNAGISRRSALRGLVGAGSGLLLAGCDRLGQAPWFRHLLNSAEGVTMRVQRALLSEGSLAREFSEADISADFRANGTIRPTDALYNRLMQGGFAEYRLVVDGLVERPLSLSLAEIRSMPARTQITRHDCVEGWSSIGKWTGPRLSHVLDLAGLQGSARYIVFHCFDSLGQETDGTGQYYESIDLVDAFHPQTILAHAMNDEALPIPHGAPIRLRVERQLGYKMAKYIARIEVVSDFARLGRGNGGYWEDRGYDWYAGI